MKLVDILFVLTAAATANAILIPTDNDGSLHASSTSSQVSGPTSEPSPDTFDQKWQDIMDELDLNIFSQDQQQPIDQSSPDTFNQVSGSANEPNSEIPDQDWQDIMDIINSSTSNQNQQQSIDELDPSTSNQDQQQPIDQPSQSTPKRSRKRPIDEPGSNISKYDQKQSMNQPGPSASKQGRKQSIDEPGPGIPDKNWQRLIDEVNSDTFEDWRELFDIVDQSTSNQNKQQSTDELDPSIFDENWIDLFDIADSSTSNQVSGPTNEPNPDISNQTQQQPIDVVDPGTYNQDQHQPTDESESDNTVPNQVTGLSQRYQKTFDGINRRLVTSKVIRKKKYKEYHEYIALGLKQRLALSSEETSELGYSPKTEIRLKHEHLVARKKVNSIRQQLRKFVKKRGLEFQEPDSDSD
ncbi:hypothetical protein BATDEDRAFT_91533 [Batrachochytrium dendrobatidis JAM81]|uniref:Uncharacterized protein n=1 Tax=Batrachochytrium dendrobatidis (strain JAM81 / FGSC 10211) TaxID=684364 RepID=F4PAF1_BATDJ|nr:uncharacterized protein BATDEDRAFT_91533 [Batrachochytrium dendrobatidis JAM81]EGF77673.1 hypothetical protein BATDEDRAFT_91533 [Batrachochytrium dendrobatidis JAM81]|eukprot:XP_006681796.1 hypothetical protein BATDEDRAFT_91533 [Batrachochytrium dendrobatidis JAM81]